MGKMYFTSDLHLGHRQIVRRRGFDSVDDMDRTLIQNINSMVTANDELWILGDFSYRISKDEARHWLGQIRCRHVHLIRGNHDKDWTAEDGWESVETYHELKTDQGKLVLFHYPLLAWNGERQNSWDLHGHIHSDRQTNLQNARQGLRRYNVGVDANVLQPVSFDEILSEMTAQEDAPQKYALWIEWSDEDNRYVVTVPDLPGCMADGKTYEEAVANAQEIMDIWIEVQREDDLPVPEPTTRKEP